MTVDDFRAGSRERGRALSRSRTDNAAMLVMAGKSVDTSLEQRRLLAFVGKVTGRKLSPKDFGVVVIDSVEGLLDRVRREKSLYYLRYGVELKELSISSGDWSSARAEADALCSFVIAPPKDLGRGVVAIIDGIKIKVIE
jgi:hypothetical protein